MVHISMYKAMYVRFRVEGLGWGVRKGSYVAPVWLCYGYREEVLCRAWVWALRA